MTTIRRCGAALGALALSIFAGGFIAAILLGLLLAVA